MVPTRSEGGEKVYGLLQKENTSVIVAPLYYSFRNIGTLSSDEDAPPKLIAKQLLLHSADYQQTLNPQRVQKQLINDEAIALSYQFINLESQLKKEHDIKKYERQILKPSDISSKLQSPSISMFWDAMKNMFKNHPEYLTNNDWFYDLGQEISDVVININHPPQGRMEVLPGEDRKFNNGVFFQLRTEMRKINRILENYSTK